jgi:hypothetical protein
MLLQSTTNSSDEFYFAYNLLISQELGVIVKLLSQAGGRPKCAAFYPIMPACASNDAILKLPLCLVVDSLRYRQHASLASYS